MAILTTDAVIPIHTTDITGHITRTTVHRSIGTTVIACITDITDIIGTGVELRDRAALNRRAKMLAGYFFGDDEAPGAVVDEVVADGCVNSFFKRS